MVRNCQINQFSGPLSRNSGVIFEDTLYIFGGETAGVPKATLFGINLANNAAQKILPQVWEKEINFKGSGSMGHSKRNRFSFWSTL